MATKNTARCVGRCSDGSQCGKYVKLDAPGVNPSAPLCNKHDGSDPVGVIPPNDAELDLEKLLRRLTKAPDARTRLRAIELLLERQEGGECAACASRAATARDIDYCVARMSNDEIAEMQALRARQKDILAAAKARPTIHPDDTNRGH